MENRGKSELTAHSRTCSPILYRPFVEVLLGPLDLHQCGNGPRESAKFKFHSARDLMLKSAAAQEADATPTDVFNLAQYRRRKGEERKLELLLRLRHDNFSDNCRARRDPCFDHNHSHEGLYRVRADVHPIRDRLAVKALQQIR